jgi:hypothetical protein
MGGPYSTNGGEKEGLYVIGGKARGEETTRKTQDVGEWIILG